MFIKELSNEDVDKKRVSSEVRKDFFLEVYVCLSVCVCLKKMVKFETCEGN